MRRHDAWVMASFGAVIGDVVHPGSRLSHKVNQEVYVGTSYRWLDKRLSHGCESNVSYMW